MPSSRRSTIPPARFVFFLWDIDSVKGNSILHLFYFRPIWEAEVFDQYLKNQYVFYKNVNSCLNKKRAASLRRQLGYES